MDLLTHTVTATARESITRYTMSCWYTQMVLQIAYTQPLLGHSEHARAKAQHFAYHTMHAAFQAACC